MDIFAGKITSLMSSTESKLGNVLGKNKLNHQTVTKRERMKSE
jgi:hypothetical protein